MERLLLGIIGDAILRQTECEDGPAQRQPIDLGLRPLLLRQSVPRQVHPQGAEQRKMASIRIQDFGDVQRRSGISMPYICRTSECGLALISKLLKSLALPRGLEPLFSP